MLHLPEYVPPDMADAELDFATDPRRVDFDGPLLSIFDAEVERRIGFLPENMYCDMEIAAAAHKPFGVTFNGHWGDGERAHVVQLEFFLHEAGGKHFLTPIDRKLKAEDEQYAISTDLVNFLRTLQRLDARAAGAKN